MPNFETDSVSLCGTCILNPPVFAGARSFGYYDGELAGLIQGLKFHNRKNLVEILGPMLVEIFNATWKPEAFDLLVAVPLHSERRRSRGYNQSELLARFLSRRTGIPFERHALIRRRPTLPQVGLSDSQRRNNVRNAFRCADEQGTAGRRILLIDDVLTTGATAGSAARALINGGAQRVSVLTVARTE
jgi:ComF family protein